MRRGFVVSPVMNIQHIPLQCTSKIVVEKLQVLSTNLTNLSTSCGICLLYCINRVIYFVAYAQSSII